MHTLSRRTLISSAVLGALVAGSTVEIVTGFLVSAAAASVGGAVILTWIRRAAGPRPWRLAIATALSVMLGGPLLLTISATLSRGGTGDAGFAGLLVVMALAGQVVALPLAVVTALLHVVVARATA